MHNPKKHDAFIDSVGQCRFFRDRVTTKNWPNIPRHRVVVILNDSPCAFVESACPCVGGGCQMVLVSLWKGEF